MLSHCQANTAGIKLSSQSNLTLAQICQIFKYFKGELAFHLVTFSKSSPLKLLGGAKLDIMTSQGVTPLYLTCKEGDNDAALSLIKGGANINSVNVTNSLTPLMIAIIEEHGQLANMLMKVSAWIDRFVDFSTQAT